LHFVCKYRRARQMLEACRALIPATVQVYVHFDAWYASARLLKYIRRQGWHATCAVKANRTLSGQRMDQRDWAQQHRRYVSVDVRAADGTLRTYQVRHTTGYLTGLPCAVRGLVSKRHYRDRHPVYFICTDLSLAPHTALQWYAKRWNCEVDHTYLKLRLGLGDFRLQPFEAIDKFCAVVHLAWAYLQWRLAHSRRPHVQNPADVLRMHRDEHARNWLIGVCRQAIATGDVEAALSRYLPQAP
jgi:Transposase DDE domain